MNHIALIFSTSWVVHQIGDFPLQNSFLALRKRIDTGYTYAFFVASLHGFVYSLPFLFFYLWNPLNPFAGQDAIVWFLIAAVHSLIDFFNLGALWVRIYNWDWRNWKVEKPSAPFFVMIAIDQVMHYVTNILILSLPYWGEWQELIGRFAV